MRRKYRGCTLYNLHTERHIRREIDGKFGRPGISMGRRGRGRPLPFAPAAPPRTIGQESNYTPIGQGERGFERGPATARGRGSWQWRAVIGDEVVNGPNTKLVGGHNSAPAPVVPSPRLSRTVDREGREQGQPRNTLRANTHLKFTDGTDVQVLAEREAPSSHFQDSTGQSDSEYSPRRQQPGLTQIPNRRDGPIDGAGDVDEIRERFESRHGGRKIDNESPRRESGERARRRPIAPDFRDPPFQRRSLMAREPLPQYQFRGVDRYVPPDLRTVDGPRSGSKGGTGVRKPPTPCKYCGSRDHWHSGCSKRPDSETANRAQFPRRVSPAVYPPHDGRLEDEKCGKLAGRPPAAPRAMQSEFSKRWNLKCNEISTNTTSASPANASNDNQPTNPPHSELLERDLVSDNIRRPTESVNTTGASPASTLGASRIQNDEITVPQAPRSLVILTESPKVRSSPQSPNRPLMQLIPNDCTSTPNPLERMGYRSIIMEGMGREVLRKSNKNSKDIEESSSDSTGSDSERHSPSIGKGWESAAGEQQNGDIKPQQRSIARARESTDDSCSDSDPLPPNKKRRWGTVSREGREEDDESARCRAKEERRKAKKRARLADAEADDEATEPPRPRRSKKRSTRSDHEESSPTRSSKDSRKKLKKSKKSKTNSRASVTPTPPPPESASGDSPRYDAAKRLNDGCHAVIIPPSKGFRHKHFPEMRFMQGVKDYFSKLENPAHRSIRPVEFKQDDYVPGQYFLRFARPEDAAVAFNSKIPCGHEGTYVLRAVRSGPVAVYKIENTGSLTDAEIGRALERKYPHEEFRLYRQQMFGVDMSRYLLIFEHEVPSFEPVLEVVRGFTVTLKPPEQRGTCPVCGEKHQEGCKRTRLAWPVG